MNGIKRILAASLIICVSACSYKPEVIGVDTVLSISLKDIKGTQLSAEVTPSIDVCWYFFDIISVSDFNALSIEAGSEQAFMQKCVDDLYEEYQVSAAAFRKKGDKYICSFDDLNLYFGHSSLYYTGLVPETDYYAVAFCVDPQNRVPCSHLQLLPFKTAAISTASSNMELAFMVQDGEDFLYYYTKPTLDGKICREPYLACLVSDRNLEEYGGDINAYAVEWYKNTLALGFLQLYLKNDISRSICYIDKYAVGEGYTIIGAPYNINNMNKIFTLHFVYTPGMVMDRYTNDQMGQ